jgi:tripartite-type tricarboxylate transporter receptor subunit TctC
MDPHQVSRRRLLALSACGFTATSMLAATPRPAAAAYPDRYVTMVVPFAPGGATDLVGRAIAVPLPKLIGQSVLIENRAGAGGNIGITYAGHAAADGYTLLCTSSAFVVNPSLYSKVTYDPFKDFVPIADLGASPNVIVADPKTGLKSLADLIARAKADPQLFNYSSAGAGTTPHLSAELLKLRAGINLTHVPYGGAGPALQGVLSGVTQLGALNLSVALAQINAGTVTARDAMGRPSRRAHHGRGRLSQFRLGDVPGAVRAGRDSGGHREATVRRRGQSGERSEFQEQHGHRRLRRHRNGFGSVAGPGRARSPGLEGSHRQGRDKAGLIRLLPPPQAEEGSEINARPTPPRSPGAASG